MTRGIVAGVFLLVLTGSDLAHAQNFRFPSLLPFRQQRHVEPVPLTDQAASRNLIRWPRLGLFSQPQPGEPTLLERVQTGSQQLVRNTGESMSNFAWQTNNSLRNSTIQTWTFFNRAVPGPAPWLPVTPEPPMIVPPRNSYHSLPAEPRIRF